MKLGNLSISPNSDNTANICFKCEDCTALGTMYWIHQLNVPNLLEKSVAVVIYQHFFRFIYYVIIYGTLTYNASTNVLKLQLKNIKTYSFL